MTLELRLRAEAELDLADAALWYEEHGDQRDRSSRSHAWQPESAPMEEPHMTLAREMRGHSRW